MGKGGEKAVNVSKKAVATTSSSFKLSHMETEELRKWGKSFGIATEEREKLLSELDAFADGIMDPLRIPNLPVAPPTFTFKDVIQAIPKHCFQRSLIKSLNYMFVDLVMIGLMFYGIHQVWTNSAQLPLWLKCIVWPVYWYSQGAVMTGIWVLAHECGHQAFSEYETINNVIGTVLHSALLVPYHNWRITHGRHHNNTGSVEHDEVFTPVTRKMLAASGLRKSPLANAIGIVLMLTIGWIPGYLVFNSTGPEKYQGKNANHFSPTAVFFKPEEYWFIVQSNLAFFTAVGALLYSIYTFGFQQVAAYYIIPYMVVNYHLVLITFLQHTDVYMPHFREKEWDWFRGACCTVDRSFGPVLNHVLHRINDLHVCHHLFSKMPFYHHEEATEHIKRVLGPYYLKDDTPIAKSLWRAFSMCQMIEDEGDIVFYKNVQ